MPTMEDGTRWYAMPAGGEPTAHVTPFSAFMALDKLDVEGDVERWSAATGRRDIMAHRGTDGRWLLTDEVGNAG